MCILLLFLFNVLYSQSNGEKKGVVGEKEQWCITTLGYVKAFSRQYAAEVCSIPCLHLSWLF